MLRTLFLFCFLFTSFAINNLALAENVHEFLQNAKTHLESKTDQAHLKMTTTESNGEEKIREMNLKLLHTPKGFKALVRMTVPADMKGTTFLSLYEGGKDQQWLYIPSSKQVRRIVSTKTSSGILGSELKIEDLDPLALKKAKITLASQNLAGTKLEVTPAHGSSEYSKVIITFAPSSNLPTKTEYYVGSSLEKTVEFLNYQAFNREIYRAQKIHIHNLKKSRSTDLDFTNIQINGVLPASQFSPGALKDN